MTNIITDILPSPPCRSSPPNLTTLPSEILIDILITKFSSILHAPRPIYTSHILPHTGSLSTTLTLWDTWTLSTSPLYTTAVAIAHTSKPLAEHVLRALELIVRNDGDLPDPTKPHNQGKDHRPGPIAEAEYLSISIIDSAQGYTEALTKTEVAGEVTLPEGLVTIHALRGTLAVVRGIVATLGKVHSVSSTMSSSSAGTLPSLSSPVTTESDRAGTALITRIRVVERIIKTRVYGSGYGNWSETRKLVVEAVVKRKKVR